ncbi:MAG: pilus assembly protein TadG-related protein [Sphingomonadaceae bacterium]|nr:pilus assembly protein TadG-related protein [Sphingomonadaceae bacterium]
MLVAVGVPMLIGGAGAAVDIAQWYAWKRELQQATDQGALAAAWALSNTTNRDNYRTRGTQDYNNNLALTRTFASAPTFQLANYANGSNNSVIVRATATRALPFSSFITGNAVTIGVYSQASFQAGQNYSACLIAVGDNGTTFSVGGNANVQARCGLAALSCSDDAIVIDGSATVVTDSIATCGTASVPSANESVLTEKVTGLTDSFSDLTPPTNNTPRTYACTGNGRNAQASPRAGTYSGLTVRCRTTFGSGIYVIDGGELDLTGNFTVTGSNVMFVLKNGATLKLGGSGNNNTVSLTPMQASDFVALGYSTTLANRYANMLIFEDRNSDPTQDHIINGNSTSLFQGTIYLPKGTARLNGTASISSTCLQISARRINVQGNAYLDTRCTSNQTNSAGTSIAKVNLVA